MYVARSGKEWTPHQQAEDIREVYPHAQNWTCECLSIYL